MERSENSNQDKPIRKAAKNRNSHINYHTGLPCNCGFTSHLADNEPEQAVHPDQQSFDWDFNS